MKTEKIISKCDHREVRPYASHLGVETSADAVSVSLFFICTRIKYIHIFGVNPFQNFRMLEN